MSEVERVWDAQTEEDRQRIAELEQHLADATAALKKQVGVRGMSVEYGKCVTHHICECYAERMKELEQQLAGYEATVEELSRPLEQQISTIEAREEGRLANARATAEEYHEALERAKATSEGRRKALLEVGEERRQERQRADRAEAELADSRVQIHNLRHDLEDTEQARQQWNQLWIDSEKKLATAEATNAKLVANSERMCKRLEEAEADRDTADEAYVTVCQHKVEVEDKLAEAEAACMVWQKWANDIETHFETRRVQNIPQYYSAVVRSTRPRSEAGKAAAEKQKKMVEALETIRDYPIVPYTVDWVVEEQRRIAGEVLEE